MKKMINKIFGIFIAASMTVNCGIGIVHAESDVLSISDTKTTIIGLQNANPDNYVEGAFGDTDLGDLTGIVYTSDNENVVTVDEEGQIIENNYGSAKVTATYGGLSASVLITVSPEDMIKGCDRQGVTYGDIYTRAGGYEDDGSRIKLTCMLWANPFNGGGNSCANSILQAWFYDNGQTTDSEAGLQFGRYSNGSGYEGTGVVGVLKSADDSYRISSITLRNSATGKTDLFESHLTDENSTDTGIARTKGWHQVSAIMMSGTSKLYLDGQLIKTCNWGAYPGIINTYSGTDTNHTAQFKMPDFYEYNTLSSVTVSAGANGLTASYEYNGSSPAASYQWYEADSADSTDWTAIENATEAVYTNVEDAKYYRAGVKISDTTIKNNTAFTTNEVYSTPISLKDADLSISNTNSIISLNEAENKVSVLYGVNDISGTDGISYSSDNENVLTVSENGEIIEKNYGSAKVTVSYKGKTASMLITVSPDERLKVADTRYSNNGTTYSVAYGDTYTFNGGTETDGGSTIIKLYNMSWANVSDKTTGTSYENTLQAAWFYDNGQTTDSEAGLQFSAYSKGGGVDGNGGTGVIGVLKSADASYRISNIYLRNKDTGHTNLYNSHLSDGDSTDTGILRTKGWHQVSLLNEKDSAGKLVFKLYFDGQLIKTYTDWSAYPGIINMYAGADSNHAAQFKMPIFAEYHALSDVTVSADANGLTASYKYNGSSPAASYQWYEADSADSASWTAIENAAEASYTNAQDSKYYRVGVKISDTTPLNSTAFTTNEVYSAPFKYAKVESTALSYQNGTVKVAAKDAISNGMLIVTSYNESDGYKTLADVKFYDVNCEAYSSTDISVGALTDGQKIMLWNSLSGMVPICPSITAGN